MNIDIMCETLYHLNYLHVKSCKHRFFWGNFLSQQLLKYGSKLLVNAHFKQINVILIKKTSLKTTIIISLFSSYVAVWLLNGMLGMDTAIILKACVLWLRWAREPDYCEKDRMTRQNAVISQKCAFWVLYKWDGLCKR